MDTPILVTVRYTVKPGKRQALYRKIAEQHIDVDSRAEAGNRKYDYYLPLDSENDLCLLELWTSAQAQKEHGATPHYQLLTKLKEQYVENAQIQVYPLAE